MLHTKPATIAVLLSILLSLSTTFAFGAIIPTPSSSSKRGGYFTKFHLGRRNRNNSIKRINKNIKKMGGSHSSLEASTADGVDSSNIESSSSPTTTTITQNSNGDTSNNALTKNNSAALPPQQQYTPPSTPIKPLKHYIFLVHGWLGNDLEMGSLSVSFRNIISPSAVVGIIAETDSDSSGSVVPKAKRPRRSRSSRAVVTQDAKETQSEAVTKRQHAAHHEEAAAAASEGVVISDEGTEIVVHSVKCNVGRTNDGIRNGGTRLANEIIEFIRKDARKMKYDEKKDDADRDDATTRARDVTYSIVGNSLGGLYARYAISLLPYQLSVNNDNDNGNVLFNLHPNVFCTTATPHLGVSRQTYFPIPRIAETIIGAGMDTTGRDLFRLNSEKNLANAAAGNIVGGVVGGVRRLSALSPRNAVNTISNGFCNDAEGIAVGGNGLRRHDDDDDNDMECIIRNMCLQEKYLAPLRNFRRRIAYANAYGTDFQVPTETAAFLHPKSGVGHFVVASRYGSSSTMEGGEGEGSTMSAEEEEKAAAENENVVTEENGNNNNEEPVRQRSSSPVLRPFIVAVVRTEKTSQPQSHYGASADDDSDELIRMSQSLDSLGWTKVFIDVRDRIPVPGLTRPAWLRPVCGSLDDLIRERTGLQFRSLQPPPSSSGADGDDPTTANNGDVPSIDSSENETSECILTSQELAQSTNAGDSFDFPLGHTVMIANSKSEGYTRINSQGRPVMDNLAEEMVNDVLEFE
eukprot:CAMPEP_0196130760 /NCGR_PEP_ID=MMETSP0910-20130528/1027_1 /TAXON_ID=49265 /ORGANISM="Thalassiosira rotula, Strain GSO102" /LENGTH=746 /DNA_ID=CAMNT_0041390129 /DNA_START=43 /DNA_END=2283 /DNA_ORIENTATION=-